jgi:subfamily B ATP-binding cassette protein HlyB/CyaB
LNTTGLAALEIICKLSKIQVDIQALTRTHAIGNREISAAELMRLLKDAGFKAGQRTFSGGQLSSKIPLPAIIRTKEGVYGVLLQVTESQQSLKCLVYEIESKTTQTIDAEKWNEKYDSSVILVKPKSRFGGAAHFGLSWFYGEFLRYKTIVIEILTASFIAQLFGLVSPLFTQVVIDKVLVHRNISTLNVIAIAFLAVIGFECCLTLARNYLFQHTSRKIDARLGAKLYKHLMNLPLIFFENRKVGQIISNIRELDRIREFIAQKSVSVLLDSIFSVVFIAVMLIYSVKLTLVALLITALIIVVFVISTPVFRRRLNHYFYSGSQSNAFLVESIIGIQPINSLALEGPKQKKWEENLAEYSHAGFGLSSLSQSANTVIGVLQKFMTLAILFVGVHSVIAGDLSLGQLIAFQMFAGQISGPLMRLISLWPELQQTLLAVGRLSDILNNPTESQLGKGIVMNRISGSIQFDNVTFRYQPDAPPALKKISLVIEPGKFTAFVGRSGSGKSTLAKLVQRLYIPQEGSVFVDDIDIRTINPLFLRQRIGVVLQESYLFSGTVRENIAITLPEAEMERIIQASQFAGAHEFISKMPNGYETIVGERGASLSGGQRQRIAIARALLTNPKILIFDEATSALDAESEALILRSLARIRMNRTVIMITHRLSAISGCDTIFVLDEGALVEQGGHLELLKADGNYTKLLKQQQDIGNVQG